MAGPIASFPSGLQAASGARATAVLSTNGRVFTARGAVMLVTDVVTFPPPPPASPGAGTWMLGNQRVFVNGVQTIGSTSVGQSAEPSVPLTGPMIVVQGDDDVYAM